MTDAQAAFEKLDGLESDLPVGYQKLSFDISISENKESLSCCKQ